ncbi:thiolase family protein [Streptomyces hygroscopicus]|uniref:thiolase family protein n=1 Tax=Streptomyces hygroscopicus TaxID=1912 RepID=UPI0036458738
MREAVIVDAVRTPVGRREGALSGHHPVDLGAHVLKALVQRTGVEPSKVEDVIWGCVTTIGEQSSNVGRWSALAAGWPDTVPATTVDRACGSSQQAIHFAAAGVIAGQYDLVVAGGVESMSRVPMGATRGSGHGQARGPSIRERYGDIEFSQGTAAEMVARKWSLSRQQVDEFSLESHARAAAATRSGAFRGQIAQLSASGAGPAVSDDEGIRFESSLQALGRLRTVFDPDGVVTAGNSSQISDGAAALLITTPEKAQELGLRPLARFRSFSVTGVDPVLMLTGPITATERVLQRAGLGIDDIGAFEVNEAFATIPLAWLAETGADPARLNPHGGAIALGHPLGASGARLTTTLVHHMRDQGLRYGLQTICEAGGMANAMVLELLTEGRSA